jgi:predicted nucleic-acid-binding Zn-ribbon protein
MAHLNVYIFHCSRCGEPAVSLFKERTPGGTESQDMIFPAIDLKSIRAQCSACKHTQFRDAADAAHHELLDWN